jgi:malate dehydrogenase
VDYVFFVGAKPRGPGMERKDLLSENGKIFAEQGKALSEAASKNVLALVVGNPANTNCLIAIKNASKIPPKQFFSMMRLDQNRLISMLAKKSGVFSYEVSDAVIWGNHSSTQVPDFVNAKIRKKPALEVIQDRKWLEEDLAESVQKRGAAVIAARGKSSAASAAHAAIESMRFVIFPSQTVFSIGIYSNGNPYGIQNDLVFSFPCKSLGEGRVEIVKGFAVNEYLKEKMTISEKELMDERSMISQVR